MGMTGGVKWVMRVVWGYAIAVLAAGLVGIVYLRGESRDWSPGFSCPRWHSLPPLSTAFGGVVSARWATVSPATPTSADPTSLQRLVMPLSVAVCAGERAGRSCRMGDRWGEDPTLQMWTRWRRPILVVVGLLLAVGQWERVASGEPFVVATGIGLVCFWMTLLWLPIAPEEGRRTAADAWRDHGRRAALFHGFWVIVAIVWLTVAAFLYGARPANFVVPAIPAALLALSLLQVRRAEKTAAMYARLTNR